MPWYQGIEFFSAMRRLGKEAYMFNFNGEKHGLRERENQKYWTVHLGEFFDHYLLGAPRPEWMDKPVPYLERGKRNMDAIYKPGEGNEGTGEEVGGTARCQWIRRSVASGQCVTAGNAARTGGHETPTCDMPRATGYRTAARAAHYTVTDAIS